MRFASTLKIVYLLLGFCYSSVLYAQKEADNWYFGSKAGVSFKTGKAVALTNGQLNTQEGCATISNSAGRLLFYTDGISVWDSTHNVMSNGTGLKGNSSSTQSGVIVPRPDSIYRYYIFTVAATAGTDGLRYSEVDMRLSSGKGNINSNKNILLTTPACEKITAFKHANGKDYWVIAHRYNSDTIYSYLVTSAGVSTTPVKSKTNLMISGNIAYTLGYMKVSPTGNKIAFVTYQRDSGLIANFNTSSGVVSNPWVFHVNDGYGLEFSRKGNLLYVGDYANKKIYQYDVTASTRSAFISSRRTVDSGSSQPLGALQMGPDGKIYVTVSGVGSLNIFHAPDSSGAACRFQRSYVSLSGKSGQLGLPTFIQSYFQKKTFTVIRNCIHDSTFFNISDLNTLDSVKWIFGDSASGAANTSKLKTGAYHIYKKTGYFSVKLISFYQGDKKDTVTVKIYIKNPKPNLGKDTFFCNSNPFQVGPLNTNYLSYKWNTDSTRKYLSVKAKGTYILKAKDSVGCFSSDTIVVKNPRGKASFSLSDTVKCFNYNRFSVKDTSRYTDDAWKKSTWYFGDGTFKADTVGLKSYADTGKFNIKLVISTKENCKDSLIKQVVVLPSPKTGFNINQANQCFKGHSFTFTNTTTIKKGSITYNWKFGDDSTGTMKDVSGKQYLKDSSYTVMLESVSDKNCKDTLRKNIVVYPNSKPQFTASVTSQCYKNNKTAFTNYSTIRTGAIATYNWNFGDNTSSTQKDITQKSYSSADSFKVMLLSISDKGCRDSITKTMYIWHNTSIGFTINKDTQCFEWHKLSYTNSSTLAKGSMTYAWSLGDSGTDTARSVASKTYASYGAYPVRLITTTDRNCRDTLTKTVVIHASPVASFTISNDSQCYRGHSFNFKNTSTINNGSISSHDWNMGNSQTLGTTDVNGYKYTSTDSFKVRLVEVSDKGCRDTVTQPVYLWHNTSIGFTINKDTQCFEWHKLSYTNSSTLPKGSMTYAWSLGDSGTDTARSVASKTYASYGTYPVRLITTTDRDCRDTLTKTVVIHASPVASFMINKDVQCFRGHSFDFMNMSNINNGTISVHDWNMGNSQTSGLPDVTAYTYSSVDSFKVRLIEISDMGCRDTVIKPVYLWHNTNIDFSIDNDTQCYEWHMFNFTNASSLAKGSVTYDWDLGDAQTDTSRDISGKRYAGFGSYPVRLITTTDRSCKDTLVKTARVHASPVASFATDNDRQCFRNNVFNYSNTSTIDDGSIAGNDWNLGDGQTQTSADALNYSYQSEDTFDVRLIATSDKGCRDTVSHTSVTYAQPVAKFTVPNDSQCWQKHYFNIINQSAIKYGLMTHSWDFGDATFDTAYTPLTKSYANTSAQYTIRYEVTSDHGCMDSAKHKVTLLERPISAFDINDSIQCFRGHLFSFANKTTFSVMNTLSYYWDYGNGNTSAGMNPVDATYAGAGYHPVQLVSYSSLTNCYDTVITNVLAAPHAVPGFTIDKDSQCLRTNNFSFSNNSSVSFGTMTYRWDFGDAGSSALKDPVRHYISASGSYNVKLVVTTDRDCRDSTSLPLVLIPHPKASFAVNDSSQCLNKHAFDLNNTSTLAYGIYSSKWLFDDASMQSVQHVNGKQFISPGMHKVTLTLMSGHQCEDTAVRWVYLEKPGNTVVNLVSGNDSQCLKGNEFTLNAQSTNPAVTFTSYKWIFGDGNTSTAYPVVHSYTKDGPDNLMLETTSANGCKDTGYMNVLLHPHPVSAFTSSDPCFPEPVEFTNTSIISGGSITSQRWDFGDNTISVQKDPQKTYKNAQLWLVKLITVSSYGCRDTVEQNANVKSKPVARFDFTTLPTTADFELTRLQMNNQSSADVSFNQWDFGNGFTSTEKDPLAEYKDSGSRKITLVVSTAENCKDTFSMSTGQMIPDFHFNLPNAFTPNANGLNEVFRPVAVPYVHSYEMEIFNRWGEKVFESHDIHKGWDGTYMGEPCQQGVYLCRVYIVPLKGKLYTQETSVTLLR